MDGSRADSAGSKEPAEELLAWEETWPAGQNFEKVCLARSLARSLWEL